MNSDTIKAQYRILGELRRVDEKTERLQRDVDRIPQDIARIDETLAARKLKLEADRGALDNAEKQLREAERSLREKEDGIKKAESKMMEVKTNEEYQAAIRENQGGKDEKGKLEERVIALLSEVDTRKTEYKGFEKTYAEELATLTQEKKTLEGERAKLVTEVTQQEERRGALRKELDPTVATLYTRFASRSRIVLVGTANEICLGCNMRVPPQMYNEIIGFKRISACPCATRILIPVNADTEEPR